MFEFLWNSKADKVKRNVITQDYFSGSLKMVDITSFIISLTCTCNSNKPWMDMFFAYNGKNSLVFVHQYLLNRNDVFGKMF